MQALCEGVSGLHKRHCTVNSVWVCETYIYSANCTFLSYQARYILWFIISICNTEKRSNIGNSNNELERSIKTVLLFDSPRQPLPFALAEIIISNDRVQKLNTNHEKLQRQITRKARVGSPVAANR
jgi:hypothetical protein